MTKSIEQVQRYVQGSEELLRAAEFTGKELREWLRRKELRPLDDEALLVSRLLRHAGDLKGWAVANVNAMRELADLQLPVLPRTRYAAALRFSNPRQEEAGIEPGAWGEYDFNPLRPVRLRRLWLCCHARDAEVDGLTLGQYHQSVDGTPLPGALFELPMGADVATWEPSPEDPRGVICDDMLVRPGYRVQLRVRNNAKELRDFGPVFQVDSCEDA